MKTTPPKDEIDLFIEAYQEAQDADPMLSIPGFIGNSYKNDLKMSDLAKISTREFLEDINFLQ